MCTVTTTTVIAPADRPPAMPDLHQMEQAIKRAQAAHGRKRCGHCGWSRHGADRGTLRRSLCVTCEIRWLDRIVHRLAKRVGRKAAIEALRALAPKRK